MPMTSKNRVQARGLDKTLALKVICCDPELSGMSKVIGGLLIEHYNVKTGLCYPGIDRLQGLAGCSRGTVFKVLTALENKNLIKRHRHAGRCSTNLYVPNLPVIRSRADELERSVRHWGRSRVGAQIRTPVVQDQSLSGTRNATQTLEETPKANLETAPRAETKSLSSGRLGGVGLPIEAKRVGLSSNPTTPSSEHVARSKAQSRWEADLLDLSAETYEEVIRLMWDDAKLSEQVTNAEMKTRGAGLETAVQQLQSRNGHQP